MITYSRVILLLACLCLCIQASANKRTRKADTTNYTNTRLRFFFIEPVALVDVYNRSSVRLGAEYNIGRRYSAGITLGTYNFSDQYCVKAELKRYLAFQEKKRYYLSLQGFYKETYATISDHSRTISEGQPGYDIKYNVRKYAGYGNINAGIVLFHKHHLVIDGYCGIGIRYRSVSLGNITPSQADDRYHYHESFIDRYTNADQKGWAPNISLGMRLGFRY